MHPAYTSNLYPNPPSAPWVSPSTLNSAPGYYHFPKTHERAPRSSGVAYDRTTKDSHIKLKPICLVVSAGRKVIRAKKIGTSFRGLFRTKTLGVYEPTELTEKTGSACGKETSAKKKELDMPTSPFAPYGQRNTYLAEFHPAGNHVQARNSTLRRLSATFDTGDGWQGLRHADDAQHSKIGNWPVVGHAALRQRPPPYATPRIDVQFPTPHFSNVRLNPHLEHHCNGPHPISFDITLGPEKIMCSSSSPSTPLDPASWFKQPATYPPVRRMHIQCVAEDPLPHFPWPVEIENDNAHGMTCRDVLDAITNRFLELVGEEEYNTWTPHRRRNAARAYHRRVQTTTDEGLRRIDYLGGKVVFHGLEQASVTGDMWFMYVGAYERGGR